jgi:hypothetical protein
MKKSAIRKYVDEIVSTQTSVYFGFRDPRWIRQKTDAKAGDSVTVNGIKQMYKDKPYPHYEEGYAVISNERVYNGTLLCFTGKEWIQIAGGKR